MKLTILMAGENPEALQAEFGQYSHKFERMFASVNSNFTFNPIAMYAGEAFPKLEELEGIVVTGSAFGVYDNPPWMAPLKAYIRDAYAANIPMLGICFGHQAIADALGGDVVKHDKGWSVGRHVYRLNHCPACFLEGSGELAIAASHQDQVVRPPANAQVFLSSDFTENAGLIYDNGVTMSLQPHPEFEIGYSKAICELRRENPLSHAEVDVAVSSLEQSLDNERVAEALGHFFIGARNKSASQ